jgi:hypothetical protein
MFRYMEGYNFVCTLHILNVIRLVGRVTRNGIYLVTHKTLFGEKKLNGKYHGEKLTLGVAHCNLMSLKMTRFALLRHLHLPSVI